MKNNYLLILFSIGLVFMSTPMQAQASDAFVNKVAQSISAGDAHKLSVNFNDHIELVLPGKTGVFSNSQAEMILKGFFESNPPSTFKIIHSGKKENASFSIGNYSSNNNKFRITFLSKEISEKKLIHQLRIETQDE